jgi:hypothetical protein
MRGGKRWIGAGVAVVVIAVIAFIVAQSGGSGSTPLNAIAKAAEVTQREPGGHAVLRISATPGDGSEGLVETGALTFDDHDRSRGMMTVKAGASGKEATMVVAAEGVTSYVKSEAFGSLPDGKKWVELDFSSLADKEGSPVPAASGGPEEGLQTLEKVKDAHRVGMEEIRGVPTTHYRGTLPPAAEVFGVKTHASALVVDVWIDAQDRIRRMEATVSTAAKADEPPTTTEMSIDYVDFGQVPEIEMPSQDEVLNLTSEIEAKVQEAANGG